MEARKKQFTLERDMLFSVEKWLLRRTEIVRTEFALPWGICDLVGISLDKKKVSQRYALKQRKPIGPRTRLRILQNIPDVSKNTTISEEDIAKIFFEVCEKEKVISEISWLRENNYITGSSKGWQRINGWAPLHKEIIAVELKLNRVSDAIKQARSHYRFATKSYAAMPASVAHRVMKTDYKDLITQMGIGFLAVTHSGCRTLIEPKSDEKRLDDVTQMHCVERAWREYLSNKNTCQITRRGKDS